MAEYVMTRQRFVELGADVAGSIMNQMREMAEASGVPHIWVEAPGNIDALVLEAAPHTWGII